MTKINTLSRVDKQAYFPIVLSTVTALVLLTLGFLAAYRHIGDASTGPFIGGGLLLFSIPFFIPLLKKICDQKSA